MHFMLYHNLSCIYLLHIYLFKLKDEQMCLRNILFFWPYFMIKKQTNLNLLIISLTNYTKYIHLFTELIFYYNMKTLYNKLNSANVVLSCDMHKFSSKLGTFLILFSNLKLT